MTVQDYIRFLSTEDLAEFLVDSGWDCNLCSESERLNDNPLMKNEKCDEKCVKHCYYWLQSPISDDKAMNIISLLSRNHVFFSMQPAKKPSKEEEEARIKRLKETHKRLEPFMEKYGPKTKKDD